jgi:hypothetical protein
MAVIAGGAAAFVAMQNTKRGPVHYNSPPPPDPVHWKIGEDKRDFDSLPGAFNQHDLRLAAGQHVKAVQVSSYEGFSAQRALHGCFASSAKVLSNLIPGGSGAGLGKALADYADHKPAPNIVSTILSEGEVFLAPAPNAPGQHAVFYKRTDGLGLNYGDHPSFVTLSRYGAGHEPQ